MASWTDATYDPATGKLTELNTWNNDGPAADMALPLSSGIEHNANKGIVPDNP